MESRAAICALITGSLMGFVIALAPPAGAATTCTWGGTPDHPSGVTVQRPGLTNDPAPGPIEFRATGPLGGGPGCDGKFTFVGTVNPGSSCAFVTFEGRARGIRGVARFAGFSAAGVAPARLYDKRGNVVGSENAQFLTGANVADCNTPEGMTGNHFSSVIVLQAGSTRARSRPNSFDGTCTMSGELRFEHPIDSTPRQTAFTDTATGTCTGSLNGGPVRKIPVVNRVQGAGTLSCAGGTTMTADTLVFDRRKRIHIHTTAAGALAEFAGHFQGDTSGGGVVEVNLLPYFDQSMVAACQAGNLRSARYDLVARTVTPMAG